MMVSIEKAPMRQIQAMCSSLLEMRRKGKCNAGEKRTYMSRVSTICGQHEVFAGGNGSEINIAPKI
jgi:dihydrodipicolinate reductase